MSTRNTNDLDLVHSIKKKKKRNKNILMMGITETDLVPEKSQTQSFRNDHHIDKKIKKSKKSQNNVKKRGNKSTKRKSRILFKRDKVSMERMKVKNKDYLIPNIKRIIKKMRESKERSREIINKKGAHKNKNNPPPSRRKTRNHL